MNDKPALVKLQPDFEHDGSGMIPIPFWINPKTARVERQDFWKGRFYQLIGFVDSVDSYDISLYAHEYVSDPKLATGKFPVFTDDEGEMYTYATPTRAPEEAP